MRLGQPGRVVLRGFLVGFDEENDVASEWYLALSELHHRAGKHRHATFKVDRSTPENMTVLDDAGKRIDGPLLAFHTNDIGVRGQQDRTFATVAFEARNEVCLPRLRCRHDRDVEPERSELRRKKLVELALVTRRIAGIDANDVLKECCGRVKTRLRMEHSRGGDRQDRAHENHMFHARNRRMKGARGGGRRRRQGV